MNTIAPSHTRPHPVVWVAALSVTAFSLVGIASLAGWLPGSGTMLSPAPETQSASADLPPAPATLAALPAATAADASRAKVVEPARPAKAEVVRKPRADASSAQHTSRHNTAPASRKASGDDLAAIPAPQGDPYPAPHSEPQAAIPVCSDCGVVDSVRPVEVAADASGLGAAGGGVVGGLLGSQIGKGGGKTLATILGVAGGAYAGHQIEKSQRKTTRYETSVRMADGSVRVHAQDAQPGWRTGDKVKFSDGGLVWAD